MTTEQILTEIRQLRENLKEELAEVLRKGDTDGDTEHRIEMMGWTIGLLSTPMDSKRVIGDAEEATAVLEDILVETLSDYGEYDNEDILKDEGNTPRMASAVHQAIQALKEVRPNRVNVKKRVVR